jgi:hypothetical protein
LLQRGFTLTTRLFPILGFFFAVHDVLHQQNRSDVARSGQMLIDP